MKKALILLFFLVIAAVTLTSTSLAEQPALVVHNGSTSALATGALETAGYRAQSMVLTQLSDWLLHYGVLVFLGCSATAVALGALYGDWDRAVYLLIGPAIFLFLVKTTASGIGYEWRYPNSIDVPLPEEVEPFTVSWVFDGYNRFISSVSRQLITVLMSDSSIGIMKNFMTREQIMTDLFSNRQTSGAFVVFAQEGLAQCSQEMNAARVVALGERDPWFRGTTEYLDAKRVFRDGFEQKLFTKHIGQPAARDFVSNLLLSVRSRGVSGSAVKQCALDSLARLETNVAASGGDTAVATAQLLESGASCEEIWCWMALGAEEIATVELERTQARYGLDRETFERMKKDIALKLAAPKPVLDANGKPFNDVTRVQPDPSIIPVIVGGYILKDLMGASVQSTALSQFADHADIKVEHFNFDQEYDIGKGEEVIRHYTQYQYAEGRKFELYTFAMMIPYMQGVILYGLGLMFPFFALAAIVPGRTKTLFIWAMLWAWAKSWDVGWALITLIEQFLWNLMPASAWYDPLKDPNNSPITVFQAMAQGDPAYSLATYYGIIAVLTTSVPMFTAQIFLGAHAGLVSPLLKGISSIVSQAGGAIQMWTSSYQQHNLDGMRENFVTNFAKDRMAAGALGSERMRAVKDQVKWLRGKADELEKLGNQNVNLRAFLGLSTLAPDVAVADKVVAGDGALQLRRLANSAEAELVRINGAFQFYNAGKTAQYAFYELVRAGISRRGEYWNIPEAPSTAMKQLEQISFTIANIGVVATNRIETAGTVTPYLQVKP